MQTHIHDYFVRTDECDRHDTCRAASLNSYLQEAACHHGMLLGVGMAVLKPKGLTWMLLRSVLNITRFPRWRDTVRVTTWPSGTRGRLIATREYSAAIAPDETPFLTATSEWGLVDIREQRITRLTDEIRNLRIPPETPPSPPLPRIPDLTAPTFTRSFAVRESQIDFNHHVNNSHYVAWIFDVLPKSLEVETSLLNLEPLRDAAPRLARLDISFRLPANIGDTVVVNTQHCPESNTCLHTILRASDNALLIHAQTTWQ